MFGRGATAIPVETALEASSVEFAAVAPQLVLGQPETIDDLSDFMAGKILSCLGIENSLYPAWTG